jgi:hypothetical protein
MTTIRMQKRKSSASERGDGFTGFSEYSCQNPACVLSRFDRFSMAASANAACPVCGKTAVPAVTEEAPPSN